MIDHALAPYVDASIDAPVPASAERVPDAVALADFPPLSDDLLPRRR